MNIACEEIILKNLRRAIELAGSQKKLAKICLPVNPKIDQSHISKWLNRDKKIPAEYVLIIEKALKGQVTRHELRPDIYPEEG